MKGGGGPALQRFRDRWYMAVSILKGENREALTW